ENILRQRLLSIDWGKETANCYFYRTYAAEFDTPFKTAVGEEMVFTVSSGPTTGLIYPANPMNAIPHREISSMIDRVDDYMRQFYRRGEVIPEEVTYSNPFIISNTVLGFFVDNNSLVDLKTVAVLELSDGSIYLQEVIITVKRHHSNLYAAIGSLNTRTLELTEIKKDLGRRLGMIIPFRDGYHIVASSLERGVESSRMIWGDGIRWISIYNTEHSFLLIRNPLRVDSLLRMASIAVQKSGRETKRQLNQISHLL
ncbi:hypothetical protein PENTCL1PPCAC_2022, partial [Pristionchus entomophagus]